MFLDVLHLIQLQERNEERLAGMLLVTKAFQGYFFGYFTHDEAF